MVQGPYAFRPVTLHDLPLINGWRDNPHVAQWWDDDGDYEPDWLDYGRVRQWIVSHGDRPFAYIQDYTVHGWEGHYFAHLPLGSRGIDQFIGAPDMMGGGHGSALIKARLAMLFAEGVPVVATDPHPDNARAIKAYQKAGFQIAGPALDSHWGRILPMTIAAEPQPRANKAASMI
ncbi:MAG: GNAT family N-acetyltransferase [Rhodospirillaceae bacterium]